MNTAEFLSHILPKQGYKFIAVKEGDDKPWVHKPTESTAIAADIAEQADGKGRQGVGVYHACASFKQAYIESETEVYDNGKPKRRYRVEENAGWVKSFWLDLDCGEGKDYPTQREAVADIVRFCKETGLPRPLLVSSGYGVHCYWVMTSEIEAVQWKRAAVVFRSVVDHFKVRHDPMCTTDVCRVLRPVGTHNRKHETPAPVKVLGPVPAAVPPRELVGQIMALVKTHAIEVKQPAPKKVKSDLNSDLVGGTEYPPSSVHEIINHCAQVRDFAEAKGNVSEPLWYAMLGLLKHTIESPAICHEWSSGHPQYDEADTQRKIDQWNLGPTTCARFDALNPTACAGCKHKDKITSPIQLGAKLPEHETIEEVNEATGQVEQAPELPPELRGKYAWNGHQLCAIQKGEDGVNQLVPFANVFLYPQQHARNLEDTVEMTWVVRERPGAFKKFEMTGEATGVGGREIYAQLGRQGVVSLPGGKKHMEQYVTDWFNDLRQSKEEIVAHSQFGWCKEGFLLGDRLLKYDGTEERVRVQGDAERYVPAFEPRGSLDEWIKLIDFAYNREQHEQFQYMIGVGFGAPLVNLMGGNMAGCIINGYSPETAQGKSTAGKVALGIYGVPDRLALSKQQATSKGLFAYTGIMRSLPILLDEITNTKGYELSELVYTFSQGTGRLGATANGTLRSNVYEWATLMAATSNRSVQSTLAANKVNATPEIARVYEYKFNRSVKQMSKLEADDVMPAIMDNSGVAGDCYMRYVVSHVPQVKELMVKTRKILTVRGNMTQDERFWLAGMTCIFTGLLIAKKLGLIGFDINALMDWAFRQVRAMRHLIGETDVNVLDQFGVMLNELAPNMLVTDKEGDARHNEAKAAVIHAPRGQIAGRVILSTNTLYLPISVIRKWCSDNQADLRQLQEELILRQWAVVEPRAVALGKGTSDWVTAPSRCYKINLALAGGELKAAQTVTQLRSVK